MSGTVKGGREAAKKNKELYGKDFYARIGAAGGRVKARKGFAVNRDLARRAGARGGHVSRRRSSSQSST